jgi:hypothetical protein
VTIRTPTLLLQTLPQGPNPKRRSCLRNPVHSLSVLENFKSLRTPAVSDSSGDRPPEFLLQVSGRRPPDALACDFNYVTPPAPTEASAIFTPGPMVEEMEIFFM